MTFYDPQTQQMWQGGPGAVDPNFSMPLQRVQDKVYDPQTQQMWQTGLGDAPPQPVATPRQTKVRPIKPRPQTISPDKAATVGMSRGGSGGGVAPQDGTSPVAQNMRSRFAQILAGLRGRGR